jgi:hypothetical protein
VELRDIEIFLRLAEELHFGQTAERLHVSQARVSQAIKAQERRIGGALFDRTSRAVVLTPLGQQLREDLRAGYDTIRRGVTARDGIGARDARTPGVDQRRKPQRRITAGLSAEAPWGSRDRRWLSTMRQSRGRGTCAPGPAGRGEHGVRRSRIACSPGPMRDPLHDHRPGTASGPVGGGGTTARSSVEPRGRTARAHVRPARSGPQAGTPINGLRSCPGAAKAVPVTYPLRKESRRGDGRIIGIPATWSTLGQ